MRSSASEFPTGEVFSPACFERLVAKTRQTSTESMHRGRDHAGLAVGDGGQSADARAVGHTAADERTMQSGLADKRVSDTAVIARLVISLEELHKSSLEELRSLRANVEESAKKEDHYRSEPSVGYVSTVSTMIFGFAVTSFQSAMDRWVVGFDNTIAYHFSCDEFNKQAVWESPEECNHYCGPSELLDAVPWITKADVTRHRGPQPSSVVLHRPEASIREGVSKYVGVAYLVLVSVVIVFSAAATSMFIACTMRDFVPMAACPRKHEARLVLVRTLLFWGRFCTIISIVVYLQALSLLTWEYTEQLSLSYFVTLIVATSCFGVAIVVVSTAGVYVCGIANTHRLWPLSRTDTL